jgi:hypothetical protein
MSSIDKIIFFESEVMSVVQPIQNMCEKKGYAFLVAIVTPLDGVAMSSAQVHGLFSSEQREKIFDILDPLPQGLILDLVEKKHDNASE